MSRPKWVRASAARTALVVGNRSKLNAAPAFDEEESRRIYGPLLEARQPVKQYVRRSSDERCAAVTAKGRHPCPNYQFADSPFCTQHDVLESHYVYCGCHPTGLLAFAYDRALIGNPPRKCVGCGLIPTIHTEPAPQDRQDPRSFPPGWNPEIPFDFKAYRLACKERGTSPVDLLEIRNLLEQKEIARRALEELERERARESWENLQREEEDRRRQREIEEFAGFDKAIALAIERQKPGPNPFAWVHPSGVLAFCGNENCPNPRHFEIAKDIRAGLTAYDPDHPDVADFVKCHSVHAPPPA